MRQFCQVGTDGGCTAIVRVVRALGVDEHGNVALARGDGERTAESGRDRALGVVGDDERIGFGQQGECGFKQLVVRSLLDRTKVLEVEAEHLLVAAENARLVMVGNSAEEMRCGVMPLDWRLAMSSASFSSPPVMPTTVVFAPRRARFMATLAAPPVGVLAHAAHDGHGRFGRDAADFSPDVLVEHHVTDDEQALAVPCVLDVVDDPMQLSDPPLPLWHATDAGLVVAIIAG